MFYVKYLNLNLNVIILSRVPDGIVRINLKINYDFSHLRKKLGRNNFELKKNSKIRIFHQINLNLRNMECRNDFVILLKIIILMQ